MATRAPQRDAGTWQSMSKVIIYKAAPTSGILCEAEQCGHKNAQNLETFGMEYCFSSCGSKKPNVNFPRSYPIMSYVYRF
jgi:hypothetical protein